MENPSAFPMGEPNDGFAQYFVGQSYLASVLDAPDFSIHNVTFEPGCRNNWHIHHGGSQVLIAVGGRGYYQIEGQEPKELKAGEACAFLQTPSTGMVRLRANPSPTWRSWFRQETLARWATNGLNRSMRKRTSPLPEQTGAYM